MQQSQLKCAWPLLPCLCRQADLQRLVELVQDPRPVDEKQEVLRKVRLAMEAARHGISLPTHNSLRSRASTAGTASAAGPTAKQQLAGS